MPLKQVNKISSTGIYNEDGPYISYIDVKRVGALSICQTSPEVELGGGMNLHDVIHTLESLSEKDKAYFYGKDIGAHLRKVERVSTFFFHKIIDLLKNFLTFF